MSTRPVKLQNEQQVRGLKEAREILVLVRDSTPPQFEAHTEVNKIVADIERLLGY